MTHDEIRTRIKPILVDHVKAAHAAVDVAITAVRLDDRERIAELERDLAHANAGLAKMNKMADEDSDTINGLRANLAQNAAITETLRAELEQMKAAQRDVVLEDAAATPVVEEEQGPWVIINGAGDRFVFDSVEGWTTKAENAVRYGVKAHATTDSEPLNGERVITLAEAHRIAGAK